ncbi:helix-turn-helix domain-containing protein [Paenibacillus illinoisensis]|uniref:Uncharacterized protein n=1 Tax=Paenibacillus illinoisensis TaxID=59845 RepID=A0A2W0C6T4_9BACL|nr:helix-turn-helix domain-containing protein [Paenibacillus illinoisensis]PYY28150.1 Uncharacterized protein PIL02S_03291 [Paenibacillus illinoisensis]
MKHHPDLFDAQTLHHDTRLLFKLKLLLGTVCAYGGEVPLSQTELAKRMGTSTYRIRILLHKLEHEGIIHYNNAGTLFFDRYIFVRDQAEFSQETLYAKNFAFFTCDEFLSEDRNVQRFVLHYVGKELIYIPGNFRWGYINDLYGPTGLLNIRTPKEAITILKKASKYLKIKIHTENFQVLNVHSKWIDMGEIYSEGAELWVTKQLIKHRFCCDFISRKAVWQIAKVMEDYYAKFGYEYATEIFDHALFSIQNYKRRSQTFFNMIYREDSSYIVNEEQNELNEISAYFRSVMESAELNYAVQLSVELEQIKQKKHMAETNLSANDEISMMNQELIEAAHSQHVKVWDKLRLIHSCWLNRFRQHPEWFIRHYYRIRTLPAPMLEIKMEIEKYMNGQKNTRSQAHIV